MRILEFIKQNCKNVEFKPLYELTIWDKKFKGIPTTMVNFVEGTRFNEEKKNAKDTQAMASVYFTGPQYE